MLKRPKLNLYLLEYAKIFQILKGVADYANKGERPSFLFYNVTGALILSTLYGIEARPAMGATYIKVDNATGFTLAFADSNFEVCNSSKEAFHCWIKTPANIIDFTAPIYSDYKMGKTEKKML